MFDLLYVGNKKGYDRLWRAIKRKYPTAILEDASDMVHPYRFSVQIDTLSEDDWLVTAFLNGFPMCSLSFQLAVMENPNKVLSIIHAV